MKLITWKTRWQACTLALLLSVASYTLANEHREFSAEEFWFDAAGTQIDVVTPFEFESVELRIRKRGETEVWTEHFGPGVSLSANIAHLVESGLSDAVYTYEVRFVTGYQISESDDSELDVSEKPIMFNHAGSFRVEGGAITDIKVPGHRESGYYDQTGSSFTQSINDMEPSGDATPTHVTDPGNLAMGGYGVFGSTNTNDVVAGKLRILPYAGMASVSVQTEASNGDDYAWHFGASTGGNFGLQRQRGLSGSKITVLGIEEDAPSNSFMIDSLGRIGMGTATPANNLHVVGTGLTQIRMENTDAGSHTGIGTDEQGRFRIRVPDGSTKVVVNSSGYMGIGSAFNTTQPTAPLHVRSSNSAQVIVEDTGTANNRVLFRLRNNGAPKFRFENSSVADQRWEFGLAGTGSNERFVAFKVGSSATQMQIFHNGNMAISGTLSQGSSRTIKEQITNLAPTTVLEQLNNLSVHEWSYQNAPASRHIGPMAEDFYAIFGLGNSDKHIAPGDMAGVAIAASKALQAQNQDLENRISQLERQLQSN